MRFFSGDRRSSMFVVNPSRHQWRRIMGSGIRTHRVFHSRWVFPATLLILVALLARAGQLSPPAGAISPTMKTLDEISAQISTIQAGSGAAPVKRVVRGVIDFNQGDQELSQTFAPAVDPAKSVVTLSNAT